MLRGHPKLAVHPRGSAHYFDFKSGHDVPASYSQPRKHVQLESYLKSFKATAGQLAIDATSSYFYWPWCARNIAAHNPTAKFVVVLREPIARTVQHVRQNQKHSCRKFLHEPRSIEVALSAETAFRKRGGYLYHEQLSYQHQNDYLGMVKHLQAEAPASSTLFLDWQEVQQRPKQVLDRVTEFFGVVKLSKLPPIDRSTMYWDRELVTTASASTRSAVWRTTAPQVTPLSRITDLNLQDWLRI